MDKAWQAVDEGQGSRKVGRGWFTAGFMRGSSDTGLSPGNDTGGQSSAIRDGYMSYVHGPMSIFQRLKFCACCLLFLVCFWVIGYLITLIGQFFFNL
jgi:hypothetical protein